LVREKDAHEKFDNRYRREYREMIASFYADEAFTVSIEKGTFTIHMLSICKKECSRKILDTSILNVMHYDCRAYIVWTLPPLL
jgi:hypothetical protein